ncbi:MAG TPA: tail fiber domain-containing protein, partial [Ferruginibacter sp.]|nr:tail fiber domain-containing protein [Ferruginibacter sp.]
ATNITRTNAVTVLRNGNTGIGLINPTHMLHVGNGALRVEGPSAFGGGTALSVGGFGEVLVDKPGIAGGRFIIKENGNIGIGNNNPINPLSFPATLGEKILLYPGAVGHVGIGVYANELRLHSDNPGAKVSFGTQDNFGVYTENALAQRNGVYAFSVLGSLWVNGTTYASDERFKQNITAISSPLQKLMQLNGVEYEMKTTEFAKNYFQPGRQIGLLAQNVEKIIPEAVNEKDGYKGVDYARLVPLLIESIKEQNKKMEEQQKQIDEQRKMLEQILKK